MRRRNLATWLVAAALLSACKDGQDPAVPGSLTSAAGDQQAATAGAVLPTAPAALLKDTKGRPMNGVSVTFAVTAGGGSLAGTVVVKTGADGIARAGNWTLGTTAGAQKVTATVQGLPPLEFTATANAGAPASVVVSEGDGQSATVGSSLPVAPAVTVKDNFGNPVPNEPVTFTVAVGGGSVAGAAAVTDAAGTARAGGWTLGTAAGLNTLTATTSNGTSFTFAAIANAGSPTQMAIFNGDGQSASISASVAVRPAVVVRDQFGNGVQGVTVIFSVASGGGTVTGAVQTTGTTGIAVVGGWQLGNSTGANTLIAQSAGLNNVTFNATGIEAAVYTMSINAGDDQTSPAGWSVGVAPSVRIRDQHGNPGANIAVTFSIASGGGTLTGANATTDANGVATVNWWRLGGVGANTLTANATGMNPVTFTATAGAPPASTGYDISIAYVVAPSARQHQAVLNAVTRWQQAISDDLSDFPNLTVPSLPGCYPALVNDNIDDVLIIVDFRFIDGPSNVLGSAGWCARRQSNSLPAIGQLRLDAADLANMENNGTLDDVVLHEIGHVLGIGSLWSTKGLLSFANSDSSTFTGAAAGAAFLANGGTGFSGNPVPVENCKNALGNPIAGCGGGTRDSHWREAVLGRELMTGYISGAGIANPMSAITIQSLADLGYVVNTTAADNFTVGAKPLPGGEPLPIFLHEAKPSWSTTTLPDR